MSKFLDELGLSRVWQNIKIYVQNNSGGGGSTDSYSTEETRIGTWIDGKPLYRRVTNCITPENGKGYVALIAPEEIPIDTVVHIFGTVKTPSGFYNIPHSIYATSSAIPNSGLIKENIYATYNKRLGLILEIRNYDPSITAFSSAPATVIIEYTKTTD